MTFLIAATWAAGLGCGARGGGTIPEAGVSAGCIGTCVPDPGSRPANCAAEEAGLEFFRIWDFERVGAAAVGTGRFMYSYTDRSTPNISPVGFSPPAQETVRCGAAPTWAMNIRGGPFRGWGGGVGIGFNNLWGASCPAPGCPAVTPDFPEAFATFDVSQWDGISFWGRRGPNSQAAVRVGLGDKHTDDDISYRMYRFDQTNGTTRPRYCERNRECGCTDLSKACSFYADPAANPDGGALGLTGYYCWNPGIDPPPQRALNEFRDPVGYPTCGVTKCEEAYAADPNPMGAGLLDPAFNGRACTPYSFSNGTGGNYCFDPATDPAPFSSNESCGDHWVFPVTLTTDWHLYLIPFTLLQQQGFGKKFARPELAAASMLRMMWDVGWVDYWVDDVGFYRVRK